MEADCLREGDKEDDWTRVIMSLLRLTVWESGSDVKKRQAAESRQMSDYRPSLLNLCISFMTPPSSPINNNINHNNDC